MKQRHSLFKNKFAFTIRCFLKFQSGNKYFRYSPDDSLVDF